MLKEKKNEIWIGHTGAGYFLNFTDKYYLPFNEKRKELLRGNNFYTLIEVLTYYLEGNFYDKGIKLKFEKNPVIKIPEKEKQTIKMLINRLEKDAKENRDLKYSLKIICELSKEDKYFSKYKITK